MKITKKVKKEFIKSQLASNKAWQLRALIRLYSEFQTGDEKISESVTQKNGVGFTGVDGEILTSFAKQYEAKKFLSDKQFKILNKKMPKYWEQVLNLSDENKLNHLIEVYQANKSNQLEIS